MIGLIWAEAIDTQGRSGAIGYKGKIPWQLKEDLENFKQITNGKTVIMGRKTYESLPIKPLPNRENIIISRNSTLEKKKEYKGVKLFSSLPKAIENSSNSEVWIIGGSRLYNETIRYADKLVVTYISEKVMADTYAPIIDDSWTIKRETEDLLSQNGINYKTIEYKKKQEKLS